MKPITTEYKGFSRYLPRCVGAEESKGNCPHLFDGQCTAMVVSDACKEMKEYLMWHRVSKFLM
jgi:hypothetical protein